MAPIANRGQSRSVAARSFSQTIQSGRQICSKKREIALDSTTSANHHMVRASDPFCRHDFASEGPKAALHSISDHGTADLFGNGKTDAHGGIRVFAITDEQNEAGGRCAPTAVRGKEIGALLKVG
jgi:hypothetical protein